VSDSEILLLFQIWILSDKKGHKSRYEQKTFSETERIKSWQLLVSPKGKNDSIWINQDAFISIIQSNNLQTTNYQLNKQGNGVCFILIQGEVEIDNQTLKKCDAVGIWGFYDILEIKFLEDSKLLVVEVPMR
jgi:redox-sensitive bicupin YhaK (pirin superfamily)